MSQNQQKGPPPNAHLMDPMFASVSSASDVPCYQCGTRVHPDTQAWKKLVTLVHVPTHGWRREEPAMEQAAHVMGGGKSLAEVGFQLGVYPDEADRLQKAYRSRDRITVTEEQAEIILRCC